ncbi:MAG: MlaD family protein, partial [Gammaproteobacteria bacterium]
MSERANPAVVGGFVIGALVLVVAGVLLFGSGAFLRERVPAVAFFDGNVRGLQVGSAVEFRGVRVGTVTDIQLAVDASSKDLLIPVYLELDSGSLTVLGAPADAAGGDAVTFLDDLVARGLRARLDLKSFVTGQLAIGLDMYPHTAIERVGAVTGVYELPTVTSTLDRVAELLQELPLQDIAVKLIDTLDNVARLLADDALSAALRDVADAAAEARRLTGELRGAAGPMIGDLRGTLEDTRAAVGELARSASGTLDRYGALADTAAARIESVS